ncbi:hypothetical protein [Ferruginibacter albus]|uniref:hypothetical protein n=1 Tax=Ferruginibacter albus TaxID=2875540 RepID=UPI001CC5203B|nr:hypothetical protein [Ferruginibacter albus]UAY51117.1 hypothetical protein K9M53_11000 [Ferruginibacter albus]
MYKRFFLMPLLVAYSSLFSQNQITIQLKICNGLTNKENTIAASKIKVYCTTDTISRRKVYIGRSAKNGELPLRNIDSLRALFQYLYFKENDAIDEQYINLNSVVSDTILYLSPKTEIVTVAKPAIYLYPEKSCTVSVKLDFKGRLQTTYPDYAKGWQFTALPDGSLIDSPGNRKYEYLFWEGSYAFPSNHFQYKNGFVVGGENSRDFLYEKLSMIGLNQKEINDFLIYWLPYLEKNKYNFIHFWINDNIDNSTKLVITPQPTTVFTVYMEYKSLKEKISMPEQELASFKRSGFSAVEWGGGEVGKIVYIK